MTSWGERPRTSASVVIRCVWRPPGLPDFENIQCADHEACSYRQDALDAAQIIRSCALEARRSDPGFQERLRERMKADQHILRRLAE